MYLGEWSYVFFTWPILHIHTYTYIRVHLKLRKGYMVRGGFVLYSSNCSWFLQKIGLRAMHKWLPLSDSISDGLLPWVAFIEWCMDVYWWLCSMITWEKNMVTHFHFHIYLLLSVCIGLSTKCVLRQRYVRIHQFNKNYMASGGFVLYSISCSQIENLKWFPWGLVNA